MTTPVYDCVIVGGGMIGLSIAVELERHGRRVHVLDYRPANPIASWAAAGILPPPISRALHDPLEQLRDLSHRLYPEWCQFLSTTGGAEVEYDRCGGVYVGRSTGERISLGASLEQWRVDGVRVEAWTAAELRRDEPQLGELPESTAIYYLPDEVVVRPPRILQALRNVLRQSGVNTEASQRLTGWGDLTTDSVGLETSSGPIQARQVCLAAGPWTSHLLTSFDFDLPVEPRRGQMVMWRTSTPLVRRVINEGPRYLVPRSDGHLLVGSTVEDVGFNNDVTDEGQTELVQFAHSLLPTLQDLAPINRWAGLRPASLDGRPYLGRLPGHPRISVATGHFRSGIHLAPATARLMRQLICDQPTDLDLSPYSLQR